MIHQRVRQIRTSSPNFAGKPWIGAERSYWFSIQFNRVAWCHAFSKEKERTGRNCCLLIGGEDAFLSQQKSKAVFIILLQNDDKTNDKMYQSILRPFQFYILGKYVMCLCICLVCMHVHGKERTKIWTQPKEKNTKVT